MGHYRVPGDNALMKELSSGLRLMNDPSLEILSPSTSPYHSKPPGIKSLQWTLGETATSKHSPKKTESHYKFQGLVTF